MNSGLAQPELFVKTLQDCDHRFALTYAKTFRKTDAAYFPVWKREGPTRVLYIHKEIPESNLSDLVLTPENKVVVESSLEHGATSLRRCF